MSCQARKRLKLVGIVADGNPAEQWGIKDVQAKYETSVEEPFSALRCLMHCANSLQGDKFGSKCAPGFAFWQKALEECEEVSMFTKNNFRLKGLLILAQKEIERFKPPKGEKPKLPLKTQLTRMRSLYRMASRFCKLADVMNYIYATGQKADKAVGQDQRGKLNEVRAMLKNNLAARVAEEIQGL